MCRLFQSPSAPLNFRTDSLICIFVLLGIVFFCAKERIKEGTRGRGYSAHDWLLTLEKPISCQLERALEVGIEGCVPLSEDRFKMGPDWVQVGRAPISDGSRSRTQWKKKTGENPHGDMGIRFRRSVSLCFTIKKWIGWVIFSLFLVYRTVSQRWTKRTGRNQIN